MKISNSVVVGACLMLSANALASDRVRVPAASFNMGCSSGDDWCERDEGPEGGVAVRVPAFSIDTREVTVAEYRACVEAGQCSKPLTHSRNQYCNYDHPDREQHPVNCVDWSQAVTYCEAHGGRLPTEPEWERAARAGADTRYPWGNQASCEQAILDEVSPAPSREEPDGCYTDATWPVASRSPNALGLYDMSGNAGEWTASWYAPDAITADYAKGNLLGPSSGRQKVARGGSWDENKPNLRVSFRNVKPPEQGGSIYGSIGFRCAAD